MRRTVCHLGRDGESALLVETHAEETLVPAADDLTHTD